MRLDLKKLPSDTDLLHQIICDLVANNTSLTETIKQLKSQLAKLKAKQYGKSSEKLNQEIADLEKRIEENEEQLSDTLDDHAASPGNDNTEDDSDKKVAKRLPLPEDLSRIDKTLEPDPICPDCGGEEFRKISDDISEVLDYKPSSFRVLRYIRPRCACKNCEKVVQAYPPSHPIAKGKASAGLLAFILIQKYCNHLPFYRQSQMYAREGIELSRSTMAGWSGRCALLLQVLHKALQEYVLSGSEIHGDDTPARVLAPGLGKTKIGRIWVYVRDGRPHGDTIPPAICYFYSPDRKGIRPQEHLKNFTGTLHADAYAGFNKLYMNDENPGASIEEAACWAHSRRKFYEVTVSIKHSTIAPKALEQIGKLYDIEREIKGQSPQERQAKRQQYAKPIIDNLFEWLKKIQQTLPKKSETAKAIYYARNKEQSLRRYLDDGRIEIDNNAAERSMRTIALGRKNWMFAGSDNGGNTAAIIYSLIETAKINNINPFDYLKAVLSQIQDHNSQKLHELFPWNIKLKEET